MQERIGLAVELSKKRALLSVHDDLGPIHIITTEKKEEMEQKKEQGEEEQEKEKEKDNASSTVLKKHIVILTSPTKGNLSLNNFTWNVFLNI